MIEYKEIEFKYRADAISLTKFKNFCRGLAGVVELIAPAGQDVFYAKEGDKDAFFRYRSSGLMSQLTFKRKTTSTDSFIRKEFNLDINPETAENFVDSFLGELGYKKEFSIYKNASVFVGEWFFLSYYICYSDDMIELGRFIELELREDHPFPSIQDAWDNLLVLEKLCRPLGITPLGRIKQSLFELYKPNTAPEVVNGG